MPKARRKPQPVPIEADYGTPERHRHGGVDLVAIKAGSGKQVTHAAKVRRECYLDTYRERGIITDLQHEAAMEVRRLHETARLLNQALAIDYSRTIKGPSLDTPLAVIRANERLAQLRDATTQDEYVLCIAVCGHGEHMTAAAGSKRFRAREMLTSALDAAVRVWRMR